VPQVDGGCQILNQQSDDSSVSATEVQPPSDLLPVSSDLAQGTVNEAKHIGSIFDIKPCAVRVSTPEHEIVDVHPPRDPRNLHRRDQTSRGEPNPSSHAVSARMTPQDRETLLR
jgi:hypothetical protein